MVDSDMVVSLKYQEQQWRALRLGAHPQMIDFTVMFIAKMKKLNIPMYPNEIVRTPARQRELYEQGFSRAVGAKAPHPFGCAADIVHSVHGWSLSKKQWFLIGKLGKELAIQRGIQVVWGGDWPPLVEEVGWDPAHWQLKHWRQYMSGFPFIPASDGKQRA